MSANARDGAAQPLVHAPVVVVGAQQPVLQIGAVQQAHRAGLPAGDALARLAHRRVVAVDERNRGLDGPTSAAASTSSLRLCGVERERLLADHVLAGGQRGLGERQVKVVRRADVHDVDVRVAHELLGGVERPIRAELGGRRLGGFP